MNAPFDDQPSQCYRETLDNNLTQQRGTIIRLGELIELLERKLHGNPPKVCAEGSCGNAVSAPVEKSLQDLVDYSGQNAEKLYGLSGALERLINHL